MSRRSNQLFLFIVTIVVEDSLGNLLTVVSAGAVREKRASDNTTNNSELAPLAGTTVQQESEYCHRLSSFHKISYMSLPTITAPTL
jgi:hypothetical protein